MKWLLGGCRPPFSKRHPLVMIQTSIDAMVVYWLHVCREFEIFALNLLQNFVFCCCVAFLKQKYCVFSNRGIKHTGALLKREDKEKKFMKIQVETNVQRTWAKFEIKHLPFFALFWLFSKLPFSLFLQCENFKLPACSSQWTKWVPGGCGGTVYRQSGWALRQIFEFKTKRQFKTSFKLVFDNHVKSVKPPFFGYFEAISSTQRQILSRFPLHKEVFDVENCFSGSFRRVLN